MWAIVGSALTLLILLVKEWFSYNAEKKDKVREILKEVPNAKTASDITRLFDRINRIG